MALIGLDTSLFIYLFEEHPAYVQKAARVLNTLKKSTAEGVFSALGMVEILTGPKRLGNVNLAAEYEYHLRNFPNLSIVGLNEKIVWIASDLRAKYGIRTPDAIHLATAIDAGADKFITNDKSLRKVKEIRVALL